MLVLEDGPMIRTLTDVLGAHGELALTTCRALAHVSETVRGRRPDGFVVQLSSADEILLLSELVKRCVGRPVLVVVTPGSDVESLLSAIPGVLVISELQPAVEIRRTLLSALVAAKWEAA